jgi:SagB-type dehydrogenase family enzyme
MLNENLFQRFHVRIYFISLLLGIIGFLTACGSLTPVENTGVEIKMAKVTSLPQPQVEGLMSLEEAIRLRRSVREFSPQALSSHEISQLLWAAQGITDPRGFRSAPSAGALYPLELYVVIAEGVFHYDPHANTLSLITEGDLRRDLYLVALNQDAILQAPLTLVITAVYARTEIRYGLTRTPRYVHMEIGHASQNILLQAVALGLGAVPIGAFEDSAVRAALGLPPDHEPLYLIPIGHPR